MKGNERSASDSLRRRSPSSRRIRVAALLVALIAASGCVDNPAPGNDREAELDPPPSAAPLVATSAAIEGIDPRLLMPEIMTEADQGAFTDLGAFCRFRMTRVGFPVVAYGSSAILKLNGRLVELARVSEGRYAADGVEITLRPLEERSDEVLFDAEFVLRLPGAPNELGFHGFGEC
ncbi:MAG TPA: DUF6692 family protein [Longimicrobiales bacterium]|nr:DUF6692 family protein [Longimicrobiales bacterium]